MCIGAGHAVAQDAGKPCGTSVNVLTHRNNNYRTGANLYEECLTWGSVKPETFGKLFTLGVQGQVYAQPLIVANLQAYNEVHGAMETHNVVFIATMENWVYAFDADGGNPGKTGAPQALWSRRLGPPLAVSRIPKDIGALLKKFNIEPFVGITSTPVIDLETDTLFLVAKIAEHAPEVDCDGQVATPQCPVENRIYALNLQTGSERASVTIKLPPPEPEQTDPDNKHPCRGYPDRRHPTDMDAARILLQRPALLLTASAKDPFKHIYLGFGSHQDAPCPMYHGTLVRFDYANTAPAPALTQFDPDHPFLVSKLGETDPVHFWIFHDEKKLGKGGIWQAGNGPAADENGNVYVITGNGTFKPGEEYGSNFLRLSPDLKQADWFAPSNVKLLDTDTLDIDLGSSGPVLLPSTQQVVGGGKQGKLYLLNRSNLGRQNPPIQEFWAARHWSISFLKGWFPISLIPPAFATGYHHIHGAPAVWGDPKEPNPQSVFSLYVWPERDNLKSFRYTKGSAAQDGKFTPKPAAMGPKGAPRGMPGGMLSVSANGMKDGILWAALPLHDDAWVDIVRGELRAFRITPDGTSLEPAWTSYCADENDRFTFAKYVPPTVANGKVYLATFSGFVSVYGLRSAPPTPHSTPDCKVHEPDNRGHKMK
jgi:outer membrane protein assembly factor BamB